MKIKKKGEITIKSYHRNLLLFIVLILASNFLVVNPRFSQALTLGLRPYGYHIHDGNKISGNIYSLRHADNNYFNVEGEVMIPSNILYMLDFEVYFDYLDNSLPDSYLRLDLKFDALPGFSLAIQIYYYNLPDNVFTGYPIYDTGPNEKLFVIPITQYEEVRKVRFVSLNYYDPSEVWVDFCYVTLTDGGGGGGCPILSVFNGNEYLEEGLLDIHNIEGNDVITSHQLVNTPAVYNHQYLLRVTEHPKTISHIDSLRLFGILSDGTKKSLPLTSAIHSSRGQVKRFLKFDDDSRVDLLGADHNNGESEFIDLEFVAPPGQDFVDFCFVIEGYNYIVK